MKKSFSVLVFTILIFSMLTASASAFSEEPDITKDFSVGEVVLWRFADSGYARDVRVIEGELPAGLLCTRSIPFGIPILSGIPIESGEFEFVVRVSTGWSTDDYDILLNINDADPWIPITPVEPTDEPKELTVTKDPTSETVNAGDTAYFISRCDNATEFEWMISDPSGETEYSADEAAAHFPGLVIDGEDTDTLILQNIPYSINGWRIQCVFSGNDEKTVKSACAIIHVNDPIPDEPGIITQPTGGSFTVGESAVISVQATAKDASLSYQWFSSPANDVSSMSPIPGATSASFTVPQSEGTMYYSVGITAAKNGRTSAVKFSDPVEVTYLAATPAPTAASAPTPVPSTAVSASDASSTPEADNNTADRHDGGSNFLFLFIVAFVLLAGLIIFLLIISKRRTGVKHCPKCGCEISEGTVTCPQCGEIIR